MIFTNIQKCCPSLPTSKDTVLVYRSTEDETLIRM